ncbi:MAG: single-stranded DNA-binding protein [Clostridia bacterium]|nr:single-stranded DNA-binding protein [Clostridia bacterium]
MNYEQLMNNKVYLAGKIVSEPVFSHEVMGEGFYELTLAVKRLSEQEDEIPLTISERLLVGSATAMGSEIAVIGQFRSYNKAEDGKSRLILRVFVREILDVDPEQNPNLIEITGFICKQPIYRTTPFKREICDLLIAVNRAYNKSDYIPCIAWGRNARFAGSFSVGERVKITGRIQSREYNKLLDDGTLIKRIAYEVSVGKIAEENGELDTEDANLYIAAAIQ